MQAPKHILITGSDTPKAMQMAESLCLNYQPIVEVSSDCWALEVGEDGVALCYCDEKKIQRFQLDFTRGRLGFRRQQTRQRKERVAQACGAYKRRDLTVLDLNAGLGRDACLLADAGCQVLMLERAPIIAALLHDALARYQRVCDTPIPLTLRQQDAKSYCLAHPDQFDVVYCDPMYPHTEKSALVKKDIRLLRALVGDDDDADELLALACHTARWRVVVKRASDAPPLAQVTPSFQLFGQSTRFDVYQLT